MTKIMVDLREFSDHSPLMDTVPPECRLFVTDGGQFCQIAHASVSKLDAMRFVLGRWKLGMENVIAFGDDVVDLDLIEESGIGVAMGNAIPEVKAVADLIAKSNDEDGVAEVLEWLLESEV
jgi:5-amino-6-(5-phospho-D-ribitylamino)uracil phosphatase